MTAAAFGSRPAGAGDGGRGDRIRRLEAERDLLVRSLRDLDEEKAAGELSPEDHAGLREDYTARAAAVLRQLEEARAEPVEEAPAGAGPGDAAASPAGPGSGQEAGPGSGQEAGPGSGQEEAGPGSGQEAGAPRRRRRRLRLAVGAAGVALVVGGLLLLVAGHTNARQTGQSSSGSIPLSPAQELVAADHAMATGNDVMALKLFQAVLNVEPNQPQALAYSGWLLRLAGDADKNPKLVAQGMTAEEAAVQADPSFPDAHFFLGVMLLDEAGDPAGAASQLQQYLDLHPPASAARAVEPILARAEAASQQPSPKGSTPGPSSTAGG